MKKSTDLFCAFYLGEVKRKKQNLIKIAKNDVFIARNRENQLKLRDFPES